MKRLLIRNATHFVNFADTPSGMMQARAFRRTQPAFKRRHIKPILQLYPSRVPLGEVLEITYKPNVVERTVKGCGPYFSEIDD